MTILNEDNSLAYLMAGRKRDPFASRRAFAQKLAEQGADTSPVQSPWQGVGRLAQALAGAYGNYTADAAEKEAGTALATKIADAGKLTDPAAKLAAYAAIDPSIGIKYSAQSAADELKTRTQRADDTMTAGFLLGTGSNPTQQAGGGVNPNNIGNVRPTGQNTGFQQPATLEDGIRLTVNNARAYPAAFNNGQPMTLTQIGQRWAPKGDGANDPDQWARNVASIGGLDPNQPIDLNNPQIAAQFARGVHGAEKGANVALPVQAYHSVLTGQGGTAPGAGGVNLAQGSADGSGNPLPPQRQGADPGAQYEAAAQRAQAAGRGDIALKYIQQATAVREAAAKSEAGVSLIPREEGGDLVFYNPRTGQPVNRIVGGAKKPPAEGGGIPGQGIENQARSAIIRAANDPAYRGSVDYAVLWGNLNKPRFDANGFQMPPEDLSAFPTPTYRFQGQPQGAPQGAPQQPPQAAPPQAAATPQGAPPAPSPDTVVGSPTLQAQPPQGAPPQTPPSGIVATPIPGMPAKVSPEMEKLNTARREAVTIVSALADFQKEFQKAGTRDSVKSIAGATTPLNTSYNVAALLAKGEELFNLGVLNGPDLDIIRRTLPDPSTFRGAAAEKADADAAVGKVIDLLQTRLAMREKLAGQPMTDLRGTAKDVRATMPGAAAPGGVTEYDYVGGKLVPRK